MKTSENHLPPRWIKVFSCLFLIFLIMPLIAIWQIADTGTQLGISAFGLELEGGKDPLIWMLAIDGVLFLAALTGLFIVTKRTFAYEFGIVYCAVAIGLTVPAHFAVGDWDEAAWSNITLQYPLLIAFLVHLIRNRRNWKNANKSEQATPRKPSDQIELNPGAPVL
jgi:hypothetical protein